MKLNILCIYFLIISMSLGRFTYADVTINGNGNTLELSSSGVVTVEAGKTLTLKDLTLTNLNGERIIMKNGTSKLKLDNAKIILDDAYSFSQGSIEVLNNSVIEGEFTFTFSGHNLFINKNSTLEIGRNTTFVCTPSGGLINPIHFKDITSSFFLNNATFKNHNLDHQGNYLGLILTNGNFIIDGTSYLENAGTTTDQGVMLGTGPTSYGDCKLVIKPNANLIIQNAALIYNNSGSKSFDTSGNSGSIETQDDANFVIATNSIPLAALNFSSSSNVNLTGINTLDINAKTLKLETPILSGQTGIGTLSSLNLITGAQVDYGSQVAEINWSPDGKYLAVGGFTPTNDNELQVYEFNGSSLTLLTNAQVNYGTGGAATVEATTWSPDSKYLAVGGGTPSNGNELQIYEFNGSSTNLLINAQVAYGNSVGAIAWTNDSKYIAIGGGIPSNGNEIQVYEFDGTSTNLLINAKADYGSTVADLKWSSDNKYLAVGGFTPTNGNELQIYEFDGSSLTLLSNAQVNYGTNVQSLDWSHDDKYLAIGGQTPTNGNEVQVYEFNGTSLTLLTNAQVNYCVAGQTIYRINWTHNGKYLAIGGSTPSNGNEVQVYEFNGTSLTLTPSGQIDYGTQVQSLNWSPDDKFLAIGGFTPTNGNEVQVYSAAYEDTPSKLKVNNGKISLQNSVKLETINLSTN